MSDSLCFMPSKAREHLCVAESPREGHLGRGDNNNVLRQGGRGGGAGGKVCLLDFLLPCSEDFPRSAFLSSSEVSIASPPPPPTGSGSGDAPLGKRRERAGTHGAAPLLQHLLRSNTVETTTRPDDGLAALPAVWPGALLRYPLLAAVSLRNKQANSPNTSWRQKKVLM